MARARENEVENDDAKDNNDVDELIGSVEELLSASASLAGAEIDVVREKIKQQLQLLQRRRRASRWESEARRAYYSVVNGADECIHRHPWEISTMALVGGILLGACLSSGRRH